MFSINIIVQSIGIQKKYCLTKNTKVLKLGKTFCLRALINQNMHCPLEVRKHPQS